jgi:hypothetical protein
VLAFGLLAAACTGSSSPPELTGPTGVASGATGDPVPDSPESPAPAEEGPGSALAALDKLCTLPPPNESAPAGPTAEGPTPPEIAEVMDQVQEIRGLRFTEPVVADPVGPDEIATGYAQYVDAAFPKDYSDRRTLAWRTIGVIPEDASIRDAMLEYGSTQVIGYYDTLTGELKFIGEEDPSPLDRITLAHELTHAVDDQHFHLESIDELGANCRDEQAQAMVGLVEGNATYFMYRWAQEFLTPEEQVQVGIEAAAQDPGTGDVPPFIANSQLWSYTAGLTFITALEQQGGVDAIDAAFENPPVSTEQIIHPERYPNDVPTPVDVPDLSAELGSGWTDLDVEEVGEMWLDQALRLQLSSSDADAASAGWDGGIYRAWSNGERVAVVLATTWDTEDDAAEFADAMQRWIDESGRTATVLPVEGKDVSVLFASDGATLTDLQSAATA